jgi:hypothetical protein
MSLLRQPLFRLLAVNLAIGVSAAALMLGGLLALNPHGLRDLIVADRSPLVALGLLLFGLIVTFGSVAMGSAVMMIGQGDSGGGKPKSASVRLGLRLRLHPSLTKAKLLLRFGALRRSETSVPRHRERSVCC